MLLGASFFVWSVSSDCYQGWIHVPKLEISPSAPLVACNVILAG